MKKHNIGKVNCSEIKVITFCFIFNYYFVCLFFICGSVHPREIVPQTQKDSVFMKTVEYVLCLPLCACAYIYPYGCKGQII